MKLNVLKRPIALGLLLISTQAGAQIIIDQADYPVSQNQHRTTYSWGGNEASYATPTEGANQVWDYQGITENGMADFPWSAATAPYFTDGYHYEAGGVALGSFSILSDLYFGVDSYGYYRYGKEQYDTTFSLTSTTGGPNDNLHFLADQQIYGGYSNDVQFPMTYGSQWMDTSSRTTPFEITIAAYGLNNTPGYHKRIYTFNKDVTGYGKLIMTHASGSMSDSMDVLLLRNDYQTIDSFFVGGAPAPAALLSAMGLTQGEVKDFHHSFFYRIGYGDVLIEFDAATDVPGSSLTSFKYNEDGVVASTSSIASTEFSDFEIYPNPAQSGESLAINFKQSAGENVSEISLTNLDGRVVSMLQFDMNQSDKGNVEIPSGLTNGYYFVQGNESDGTVLFREKILIF